MRLLRFGLLSCLLLHSPASAQQTATTSTQGVVLLQQSLGVLAGATSIADVTLTGTARRSAGSDDETGTAVLKALATGEARMDFSFPSGQRGEVRTNLNNVPAGTWTGPDGKAHPQSQHNLMTDSSWFFPGLTLTKLVASQAAVVTSVGQDFKDGISVSHLTATQHFPDVPADMAPLMQHVSQMGLFLDTR